MTIEKWLMTNLLRPAQNGACGSLPLISHSGVPALVQRSYAILGIVPGELVTPYKSARPSKAQPLRTFTGRGGEVVRSNGHAGKAGENGSQDHNRGTQHHVDQPG